MYETCLSFYDLWEIDIDIFCRLFFAILRKHADVFTHGIYLLLLKFCVNIFFEMESTVGTGEIMILFPWQSYSSQVQ